ncbi:MAG: dTDP-glucose 4,6-dehydratase [Betaproteobacteria bacterium RIFCSPLOWO2_12_FULL_68_20]|nr:MAG: dTDP-glucose 4,6-dehydratase [Betaproteobacteria bacterium RIFCSPLOWO2_12_FULL_68_20]
MRVFLAGATGAIGRQLVPLLRRAGHEVIGATRTAPGESALAAAGARPVRLDVLDREATIAALCEARPEAVIHQLTDLSAFDYEANARLRVVGTRNLVDAALAAGVRRMAAQSLAFAYAPGAGPAREDDPLDLGAEPPRRRTVEAVAALETAVAEMPEGVVLRYGLLYGPGTWYAPEGAHAEAVRSGKRAATPAVASFLHIEDAARAALAALDWPAGVVNIVDNEPARGTDWVPFLAALLGAPDPPAGRGEPWERGASNARARTALGWTPRWPSWRDGFRSVFG